MTRQRVAMTGPVPRDWGSGGRWRGGGVATHVAALVPELEKCGVSVDLLAENATVLTEAAFAVSVNVIPVTHSWPSLVVRGGRALPRMASGLLASLTNGSRIPVGQALRFLGLAANYRAFLKTVKPPLLHLHNARHAPFFCRQLLSVELPTVVTVHSVASLLMPWPRWMRSMEQENYHRADWLIAVSAFVRDRMIEFGAPADRITVIPNAVDCEEFSPADPEGARRRLGIRQTGFTVLFTGNLIPLKGVDHLVAAFARSGAREHGTLVIVGDGPERKSLASLADELGVSEVTTFVGARPLREMHLWYQACDLFVAPSTAEGVSISVLEAMSSARPVITTLPDVGEHDVVRDGSTGILVPYGDVGGLTAAIDRLLRDRDQARRIADHGRDLVAARFAWPKVARRTAEVYRETLLEYRASRSNAR